jgi:hypothetical protein
VAKIAQGQKGMVPEKKLFLSMESWDFPIFHFLFLLLVLRDVIFNVTVWIQIEKILIFP